MNRGDKVALELFKQKRQDSGCAGHKIDYGSDGYEYECDYEFSGDVDCGDCIFGDLDGTLDPRNPQNYDAELAYRLGLLRYIFTDTKLVKALIWVLEHINNALAKFGKRRSKQKYDSSQW